MTSINTNSVNSEPVYYGGELPEVVKIGYKSKDNSIFTDLNNNGIVDIDDFADKQFANYLSDNGYFGEIWDTFKDIVKDLYETFKIERAKATTTSDTTEQIELENAKEKVSPRQEITIDNNESEKISELKRELIARKKEISKSPHDPETGAWFPEQIEEYNNLDNKMLEYYEQLKQPETEGEQLIIKDEDGNIIAMLKAIYSTIDRDKLCWLTQF